MLRSRSRYDHRLHGLLLVAQGMTCPEAGRLLGDPLRRFLRQRLKTKQKHASAKNALMIELKSW
jgi:hypothetical protein